MVNKLTSSYVPALTSKAVSEENTVLVNDLYRLIKKYQAIRNIVRTLVVRLFTFVEFISFEYLLLYHKCDV